MLDHLLTSRPASRFSGESFTTPCLLAGHCPEELQLQPLNIDSLTAAIPKLSTGFPGLVLLKLSHVSLRFSHLQALGQLRCLQHLQLHNVECTREAFTCQEPLRLQHSVFAHLVQLTQLEIYHEQELSFDQLNRTQYLTEDLHGLSFLSNLQSLTVQTRSLPPQRPWSKPVLQTPVVPADKLVMLPRLTTLRVNKVPAHLATMSQLQVLSLTQLPLKKLPTGLSALQSLSQLSINGCRLPCSELAYLGHLPALKFLVVKGLSHLWGPDSSMLASLTTLKRLELTPLEIRQEIADVIARMTQLTSLRLRLETYQSTFLVMHWSLSVLCRMIPALHHLSSLELSWQTTSVSSEDSVREITYDGYVMAHAQGGNVRTGMTEKVFRIQDEVLAQFQQLLPYTELSTVGCSYGDDYHFKDLS